MSPRWLSTSAAALAALAVALGACDATGEAGGEADRGRTGGNPRRAVVVVTTSILGDVTAALVGDAAEVDVIMPRGADPHSFQASARDAASMRAADALVINGAGFEEGLLEVVDGAERDGVPVFEAVSATEPLEGSTAGEHDEPAEPGEGPDGDGPAREGADPHFFTDPLRVITAVEGIAGFLASAVPRLDTAEFRVSVADYVAALDDLHAEIETTLQPIPDERRVLVTNHEVFGSFADRYGFDVVGTVVPSGTTSESVNARDLARLAAVVEAARVPAIFVDSSAPADLAETLADEVGDVEVVELFTESLGEEGSGAATYIEMMQTNARRIAGALA